MITLFLKTRPLRFSCGTVVRTGNLSLFFFSLSFTLLVITLVRYTWFGLAVHEGINMGLAFLAFSFCLYVSRRCTHSSSLQIPNNFGFDLTFRAFTWTSFT